MDFFSKNLLKPVSFPDIRDSHDAYQKTPSNTHDELMTVSFHPKYLSGYKPCCISSTTSEIEDRTNEDIVTVITFLVLYTDLWYTF